MGVPAHLMCKCLGGSENPTPFDVHLHTGWVTDLQFFWMVQDMSVVWYVDIWGVVTH